MKNPPDETRLRLKEPAGWFAAGAGFHRALSLLSDGAFKLFVYVSLEADRRTGCLAATHKQLATALGKSKRIIGTYVTELEAKEVCRVRPGKNQFTATVYELSDSYWPYHRTPSGPESPEIEAYVESVRACFEGLGCTCGKFGAAAMEVARQLQQRAVPIGLVLDAMFLGACRKFDSWFNGGPADPIRSMAYFDPLIAEIQAEPLPQGYSTFLRSQLQRLSKKWSNSVHDTKGPKMGGV
jgi:hypothetical protein